MERSYACDVCHRARFAYVPYGSAKGYCGTGYMVYVQSTRATCMDCHESHTLASMYEDYMHAYTYRCRTCNELLTHDMALAYPEEAYPCGGVSVWDALMCVAHIKKSE